VIGGVPGEGDQAESGEDLVDARVLDGGEVVEQAGHLVVQGGDGVPVGVHVLRAGHHASPSFRWLSTSAVRASIWAWSCGSGTSSSAYG
jgi:hypothetical protein